MSRPDLDLLLSLVDKATPGPWKAITPPWQRREAPYPSYPGVNVAKVRRLRAAGAFPHARQYGESSSCHWHILGEEEDDAPELRVGPARRIEHDPPIGVGWRWLAEADPIGPSAKLLLQRVRQALGRSDAPPAEAPPLLPGGWTYACALTAGAAEVACVTPVAHALRRLRWWAVQRRTATCRTRNRTGS